MQSPDGLQKNFVAVPVIPENYLLSYIGKSLYPIVKIILKCHNDYVTDNLLKSLIS